MSFPYRRTWMGQGGRLRRRYSTLTVARTALILLRYPNLCHPCSTMQAPSQLPHARPRLPQEPQDETVLNWDRGFPSHGVNVRYPSDLGSCNCRHIISARVCKDTRSYTVRHGYLKSPRPSPFFFLSGFFFWRQQQQR